MSEASTIPTPATPDVCTISLMVGGREAPSAFHVLSVVVSRELNRIPSASIEIEDGEAAKGTFAASSSDYFVPGTAIEILLGYRSHNERVFKGLIARQRIRVRKSGSLLSVDCFAEAMKTSRDRKSRIFVGKTDSEIIEEILETHGFAKGVEATSTRLGQAVQYDATDWDFLVCRAEANGHVVIVEDDKVSVSKPATTDAPVLHMAYGSTVLELDAEMDARWQRKGVKALSWSAGDQALVEVDGEEPSMPPAGNVSAADLAKTVGDDVTEIRHGGGIDPLQLQDWADARLLRMRLARIRGRARCQGFAAVKPGAIVQIDGLGDRFAGKLYVSGVRHTVGGGNWETDVQFGLGPELFAETYRVQAPPAAGLLPAASGLQVGVVSALENDPDGEERIRCRLPLVDANDDGVWARLTTFSAGKDYGAYFRPEIGDEVVVGFLNQDPRCPVILGACHSSAKPAPKPATDANPLKGYVSRGMLKLVFDDDKKVIGLETPAGNTISVSEDAKGIVLQDQSSNRITLDDRGITIESSKDIVFKASSNIKLSGANIEISAQSAFKAAGASTAQVSGAQTNINGDALTVIKGGMVQIN